MGWFPLHNAAAGSYFSCRRCGSHSVGLAPGLVKGSMELPPLTELVSSVQKKQYGLQVSASSPALLLCRLPAFRLAGINAAFQAIMDGVVFIGLPGY